MSLRRRLRGAVEIHYDDSLAAYHCPHCGQEFYPDDALCIACGYEFADARHPYALPWRRPMPLLDVADALDPAGVARIENAIAVASARLGMEILVTICPPEPARPPEEIAWFYANAWELGGVTRADQLPPVTLPPTDQATITKLIALELLTLPWTLAKGLFGAIRNAISPPPPPADQGLALFVWPVWQTLTLEPTIATETLIHWDDPAFRQVLESAALQLGTGEVVEAIEAILAALEIS